MFCEQCGTQIGDNQRLCSKCSGVKNNDKANIGFAVLSFFIPLVGLILFIVWKSETPLKAKYCGIGALIGFIAPVILFLITRMM